MACNLKIGVIGLGYVGLPVAIAFAQKFPGTIGFDINKQKVDELNKGIDRTGELSSGIILKSTLRATSEIRDLQDCNFFVVAVPTPIDSANIPDLSPLIRASESVSKILKNGDVVVFESTVFPGTTEEICGPALERYSSLKMYEDFKLGYSPERINPGDKERTLTKITKIVSAQDQTTLDIIAQTYGKIIEAGIYKASSIRVAEAAKVIENTQRDLNIALVNELSLIFDKMNLSTSEVLEAAGTKWNFLKFKPGLVGGHCIGVDPYYLTYKAEQLGYHPEVIAAGRRINDNMGSFVAEKTVKLMLKAGLSSINAKVGILGLTFKENVRDIRNSKVPLIVKELEEYGVHPLIADPFAEPDEVSREYGLQLSSEDDLKDLDVLVLAVPHDAFLTEEAGRITAKVKIDGIVIDIKSALDRTSIPDSMTYWSL